jgi:hypothetical protein
MALINIGLPQIFILTLPKNETEISTPKIPSQLSIRPQTNHSPNSNSKFKLSEMENFLETRIVSSKLSSYPPYQNH